MTRVGDLLRRRASGSSGERVALVDARTGSGRTWRDVAAAADVVVHALDRAGVAAGARIGLRFTDPIDFAITYLAVLAGGRQVCPLDPRGGDVETAAQLDAVRPALIIAAPHDGGLASVARHLGVPRWTFTGGRLTSASVTAGRYRTRRHATGRSEEPRVVLTTSGTTGDPKLVPLTERQLLDGAGRVVRHHRITPTDRGYSPLPLSHINGQVVGILATLVAGSSLVLDDRFHAADFWAVVAHERVTWLNLAPAIITILGADADGPEPPGATVVRFARSASAPMAPAAAARFEAATGVGVLETYGMTEAAGQITANPLDPAARRRGSVGRPVGIGLDIFAVAEGGAGEGNRPVPPGVVGSVELSGSGVTERYLRGGDPTRSIPARSASGRLVTGDLGWRDEDGFVYLVGRTDDVINRGGEKVHPREVEDVLLRDVRVTAAAVVARPHPTLGQQPVAFVTTDASERRAGGAEALVESLTDECRRALAPFKRPAAIEVCDLLPAGPTGKIRHRELARHVAVGREA